jgi:hypothetical protein
MSSRPHPAPPGELPPPERQRRRAARLPLAPALPLHPSPPAVRLQRRRLQQLHHQSRRGGGVSVPQMVERAGWGGPWVLNPDLCSTPSNGRLELRYEERRRKREALEAKKRSSSRAKRGRSRGRKQGKGGSSGGGGGGKPHCRGLWRRTLSHSGGPVAMQARGARYPQLAMSTRASGDTSGRWPRPPQPD